MNEQQSLRDEAAKRDSLFDQAFGVGTASMLLTGSVLALMAAPAAPFVFIGLGFASGGYLLGQALMPLFGYGINSADKEVLNSRPSVMNDSNVPKASTVPFCSPASRLGSRKTHAKKFAAQHDNIFTDVLIKLDNKQQFQLILAQLVSNSAKYQDNTDGETESERSIDKP